MASSDTDDAGSASCAVDPHQLLNALSTLLTAKGEIKNVENVTKIVKLMRSAKKLVSRCVYINIIKVTEDKDVMNKFIADGGWVLLNGWLQDAKNSDNTPIILELIKVFKTLPVTIQILKQNNTAKLVKQMSKGGNENLKRVCNDLVDSWMSVIRGNNSKEKTSTSSSSSSTATVKKLKIKKIERNGSNGEKRSDSSEKVPSKLGKKRSSTSSTDGEAGPSKVKVSRTDSIDDDIPLSKLRKTLDSAKLQKLKASSEKAAEEPVKKRPSTAKVPRTKFRSTGLEKGADLPTLKIKKKTIGPPPHSMKSKTDRLLPIKREGPIFSKSLTPPDKKPKVTSPTLNKVKLIQAKPKHQVQESNTFMSALLNAPVPVVRKVKRRPSVNKPTSPTVSVKKPPTFSNLPEKERERHREKRHHKSGHSSRHAHSESTEKIRADSPEEAKPDPPKFGFYATIQQDDDKKDASKEGETKDGEEGRSTTPIPADFLAEENGVKKKKSVRWKPEGELEQIKYFELDATERVNVNKAPIKDFRDAQQIDIMNEKSVMKNAMRGTTGVSGMFIEPGMQSTEEYFKWPKQLIRIDLRMIQKVDYGCNSKEIAIQKQREMVVLAEIYFDKKMLPESPQEPEAESYHPTEPKKIPLEDETAVETTQGAMSSPFQTDNQQYPTSGAMGGMLPPSFPQGLQNLDIPPDVAQILQQIPNLQPGMAPGQPGQMQGNEMPSANATIKNVQNLLSSIMDNQDNQGSTSQEDLTRLRDMLEPFKNQLPGGMNQGQQNHGMPPGPPGMPPPFGMPPPGEFGMPPPGEFGPPPGEFGPPPGEFGPPPGMGPGGMNGPRGLLPPPGFPDGPPMGPGFGGPGPHFQGGPNGPNDGWNGPNDGWGGDGGWDDGWGGDNQQMHHRGGGPPRGRGRGGPPRGRGRGRGRGGRPPVCRHFMSQSGCERGRGCCFLHPPRNGPNSLLPNPS